MHIIIEPLKATLGNIITVNSCLLYSTSSNDFIEFNYISNSEKRLHNILDRTYVNILI